MTLRMKAEVRDLWAEALLSGEFEQTTGLLHEVGGGLCCLGVLCEVAVKAGVIPAPDTTEDGAYQYGQYAGPSGDIAHTSTSVLPLAVVEWAGFQDEDRPVSTLSDPRLEGYELVYSEDGAEVVADEDGELLERCASSWNDDHGATFEHIAAMVKRIPAVEEAPVPA